MYIQSILHKLLRSRSYLHMTDMADTTLHAPASQACFQYVQPRELFRLLHIDNCDPLSITVTTPNCAQLASGFDISSLLANGGLGWMRRRCTEGIVASKVNPWDPPEAGPTTTTAGAAKRRTATAKKWEKEVTTGASWAARKAGPLATGSTNSRRGPAH